MPHWGTRHGAFRENMIGVCFIFLHFCLLCWLGWLRELLCLRHVFKGPKTRILSMWQKREEMNKQRLRVCFSWYFTGKALRGTESWRLFLSLSWMTIFKTSWSELILKPKFFELPVLYREYTERKQKCHKENSTIYPSIMTDRKMRTTLLQILSLSDPIMWCFPSMRWYKEFCIFSLQETNLWCKIHKNGYWQIFTKKEKVESD